MNSAEFFAPFFSPHLFLAELRSYASDAKGAKWFKPPTLFRPFAVAKETR